MRTLEDLAKGRSSEEGSLLQETNDSGDNSVTNRDITEDVTSDVESDVAASTGHKSVTGRWRPQLRVDQKTDAFLSNLAADRGISKGELIRDLVRNQKNSREPQDSELAKRLKASILDALEVSIFTSILGVKPSLGHGSAPENPGLTLPQALELMRVISNKGSSPDTWIDKLSDTWGKMREDQREFYDRLLEEKTAKGPSMQEKIGEEMIQSAVKSYLESRGKTTESKIDVNEAVKIASEVFKLMKEQAAKMPPRQVQLVPVEPQPSEEQSSYSLDQAPRNYQEQPIPPQEESTPKKVKLKQGVTGR